MEQLIDSAESIGSPEAPRAANATDTPTALLAAALDPVESRAWRAFLSLHARVARRLEADLIARSDLPLAEYDVLFQLAMAEGRRLRMNELADRVLLSRAGITRLVDRLSRRRPGQPRQVRLGCTRLLRRADGRRPGMSAGHHPRSPRRRAALLPRFIHCARTRDAGRAPGAQPAARLTSRPEALSFGHANAQRDRRGRRQAGRDHQPGQGLLRRAGLHQARPRALLPRRRRRRAARRGRPADGPQALRQRRRRRVLLPEARARVAAGVDPNGRAVVPVRSNRRRDRRRRRGRAGLGRQPRLPRPQPAPVRADDLDHPDELRVDLDPVPGVPWDDIRRVALVVREVARRPRARRLAQDVGLARASTSTSASSGAGPSTRSGGRPWRWRARSSGAPRRSPPASGGRRSATASSSTTTRTPRTERSRPPTRSGRCPTPASRRR